MKVDELLDERTKTLVSKAKLEEWPSDYLAMRLVDLYESVGRRANLEQVVSFASKMLEDGKEIDQETVVDVDSEWLNYFIDHSEKVTTEELQVVWGAILAGEINTPGTFSKRTMSILADMSKEDVEAFKAFCSLTLVKDTKHGRIYYPVLLLDDDRSSYNGGKIKWTSMRELIALGLVDIDGQKTMTIHVGSRVRFSVDETVVALHFPTEVGEIGSIPFGPTLTRAGEELAELCKECDEDGIKDALLAMAADIGFKFEFE